MDVATESVQPMGPQFMRNGLPIIYTLDENSGIWSPSAIIIRTLDITHRSASEHAVGKATAVGNVVVYYREENYKTDFKIWNENSKLQNEHKNSETSRSPLDSTPVGTKMSKTPATYSSSHKVKAQK